MPRTGASYSLPQPPFTPGSKIQSAAVNSNFSDIATALTGSAPLDGSGLFTGNIQANGNRVTGVADAISDTDALSKQKADAIYRRIASAFRAHRNGADLTGIAPSTFTKIPFPTEVIDEGGKYDASTSRWTPPAGLLMIGGQAYLSGGLVDQQQINLAIYKNGSALANLDIKATYLTNPQAVCGQIVDVCDGDDYYELYIWANGAGNKTVGGNAFNTYFYGATL